MRKEYNLSASLTLPPPNLVSTRTHKTTQISPYLMKLYNIFQRHKGSKISYNFEEIGPVT